MNTNQLASRLANCEIYNILYFIVFTIFDDSVGFCLGFSLERGVTATFFFTDEKESSQRKSRHSVAVEVGSCASVHPPTLPTSCWSSGRSCAATGPAPDFRVNMQVYTLIISCGRHILCHPRRSDIVSELPFFEYYSFMILSASAAFSSVIHR